MALLRARFASPSGLGSRPNRANHDVVLDFQDDRRPADICSVDTPSTDGPSLAIDSLHRDDLLAEVPSAVVTSVIVAVHLQTNRLWAANVHGVRARLISFVGNRVEDCVAPIFEERLKGQPLRRGDL